MNRKQIFIIICTLTALALILWYSLPIEFPWLVLKVIKLFLMVFVVIALAIFSFVFASGKKTQRDKSSTNNKNGEG
jgi:glucan phosphoethanolaminetransferase (alkaline phosphatase superfamily)